MKPQKIGPFYGLNNRLKDYELVLRSSEVNGDYLKTAHNVELDNTHRLRRRAGYSTAQLMTGAHSVYQIDATNGYLVRGSTLYKFSLGPYSETLVKILTSNNAVSYALMNGSVYYSNGTDSGRLVGTNWYPWGMVTPASPAVARVAGSMATGWYQVALSYSNSVTGEEGAPCASTNFELTTTGNLRVTLPTSAVAGATHINVYCSRVNGETAHYQGSVAIGQASYDIGTVAMGRSASYDYQDPLPAGTQVFVYNGSLCTVSGNTVYYSPPYRPGYFNSSRDYILFENPVTLACPAQNGVYICSDKTQWFQGPTLGQVQHITDVMAFGAVPGTLFESIIDDKTIKYGWFSAKGLVVADAVGQAQAVTMKELDVNTPVSGCSMTLNDQGFRRVRTCGYTINIETGDATTYGPFIMTSASGSFFTTSTGLYQVGGDTDAGTVIDATVAMGQKNFGSEQIKTLGGAYIDGVCDYPMTLTVATKQQGAYAYDSRSSDDDLGVQRVDTGKGLRSNWFDFTLQNQSGGYFEVASLTINLAATTRKV